jgi:hypothetical protein
MTPRDDMPVTGRAPRKPFSFADVPSLTFYREIQRSKKREIMRRIANRFYDRPDVVRATVHNIIESGDLPLPD